MYAVIATGGKQYRVSIGDELFIEKIAGEEGETVSFDQVLAVSADDGMNTGTPCLEGAVVTAEVVRQGKQKKVIVFKYKAKKGYRRKKGHRQPYTRVRITQITA